MILKYLALTSLVVLYSLMFIGGYVSAAGDSHKKIKLTGTLAAIFVITQITLGALVIDLKLQAVLVAIHLGIGILLFAMVLLTTLFAFRLGKSTIQAKV